MTGHTALLADRGVVRASGADALKLVDGLVCNDLDLLARQPAIHTALLSPQGKILFAFFVVKVGADLYLDIARAQAAALVKRLDFYKLRADARFENLSADMAVAVSWGGAAPVPPRGIVTYPDPRHAGLGHRLLLPAERIAELGPLDSATNGWHAHRVALGVPEEGFDYALGDTFPHEADFDLFDGVSFTKGCYVGQEVVARMQNKTVVRKRVVMIAGDGLTAGADIRHGDAVIGSVGTAAGGAGLAMLRLDRAAEAADRGEPLVSNGRSVTVAATDLARYRESVRHKPVIEL